MDPTSEPGPPREKPTEEPTSEPKYDASSETFIPTRDDSIWNLSPGDNMKYQKGAYLPGFATPEDRIKEDPWGDIWKIHILSQGEILEA